jgi:hypothetical protein
MVDRPDPYAHCGLRGNPFTYSNDGPDAGAEWVDRGLPGPPRPGQRHLVQVIGVAGAGKSTTLRHWHALAAGSWHYVPRGVRRLAPLPVAPLVYWDEANRAPAPCRWWALRAAARRRATVVAGTHDDLAAEARAAGLGVTTVRLCALTPAEVTTWAARRFARVGGGPEWTLPAPVAAAVATDAGPSWRVAGDLLHAWVAREVANRSTVRTDP